MMMTFLVSSTNAKIFGAYKKHFKPYLLILLIFFVVIILTSISLENSLFAKRILFSDC